MQSSSPNLVINSFVSWREISILLGVLFTIYFVIVFIRAYRSLARKIGVGPNFLEVASIILVGVLTVKQFLADPKGGDIAYSILGWPNSVVNMCKFFVGPDLWTALSHLSVLAKEFGSLMYPLGTADQQIHIGISLVFTCLWGLFFVFAGVTAYASQLISFAAVIFSEELLTIFGGFLLKYTTQGTLLNAILTTIANTETKKHKSTAGKQVQASGVVKPQNHHSMYNN